MSEGVPQSQGKDRKKESECLSERKLRRDRLIPGHCQDSEDPPAAVKWSFEDYGPETHALVTQLLV